MTALPPDAVADLHRLVAELEQRLESSFAAHDEAIARQAATAQENAGLRDELSRARERQNASADILSTIANTSGDAERALYQIAETSARLFGAPSATIHIAEGDGWSKTIRFGDSSKRVGAGVRDTQLRIGGRNMPGTIVGDNRQVNIPDVDNVDPSIADWPGLPYVREAGTRSMSGSPLRREGRAIGALIVYRDRLAPFTDAELVVQQTFADQAAIAIENARLFNETKEALERQTATADILKVIASSPDDVQPAFEAIAASANRLIGGFSATVMLFVGDALNLVALTPTNAAADEALKAAFPRPLAEFPPFALVRGGETVQFADTEAENVPPLNRQLARLRGYRSMVFTPLMNSGAPIGILSVTRVQPGPFADHHVQLLQTFAAQAVIAIQNAQLFDEVQARTRDLTEALTYQTGSGNILKVIASSPTDVKPVLTAIVESACELCEADDALATLKDGGELVFQAQHGSIPVVWDRQPIDREAAAGLAVIDRKPVHVHDLFGPEGEQFPRAREFARTTKVRTVLCVPLLRDGESIGAIVLRRTEVRPFSDKQIALLQTFADQAVIAIGNVRLFDEVQARTRDLEESLQHQTATSDVLQAIGRSMADAQPAFDRILDSSVRLFNCRGVAIFLAPPDGMLHLAGTRGFGTGAVNHLYPRPIIETTAAAIIGKRRQHYVPDVLNGADVSPSLLRTAQTIGNFSVVMTPMVWDGRGVGMISVTREPNAGFNDKELSLLKTFADQAVIAIENARLFNEVKERTRELAASLDELRTAQDRLVQTEKLASLGQLTAGIAHEIKNPLNFVNNFAALSAELTDELNDVLKRAEIAENVRGDVDELTGLLKDNLQKVVQHGKRADSIVKNMLLHSREGSGDHRPADINALIDESLNLAYHGARAERPDFNVTLERDFDAGAGMIEVFPQEITRVFLNLVSNGFYAVNKRRIDAGQSGFDPVLRAATRNLGDAVEIRIRDNGTGIPQEVKEKMFNPFFTTKPAGEGTGLGLSMSHDIIVKQHGGTIEVDTEPGQFTEFCIVLPRTSKSSK